jgi:hypothetical protein
VVVSDATLDFLKREMAVSRKSGLAGATRKRMARKEIGLVDGVEPVALKFWIEEEAIGREHEAVKSCVVLYDRKWEVL